MVYCDQSDNILEWGSEEVVIPYVSPLDGRVHRYFPDFYIKVKQSNGGLKKYIMPGNSGKGNRGGQGGQGGVTDANTFA